VATSISDATHFVAEKFARTRSMLEAIAMGIPVVTPSWLECCDEARCFIDEKKYIMRDIKKEKELGFSMPVSLSQASKKPLLEVCHKFLTSGCSNQIWKMEWTKKLITVFLYVFYILTFLVQFYSCFLLMIALL
jgi:hypothetical protein